MSIKAVTAYVATCSVCDQVMGGDDQPRLFQSKQTAIDVIADLWEEAECWTWLALRDGRAYCPTHSASAPFVQTGPDLFEAVAS